jgi:hypothetical protein
MIVKESEFNNLLMDELIKEVNTPHIDIHNEITVTMLEKQTGFKRDKCRDVLERKITYDGWNKHHVINENGQNVVAYFNPAKWSPA